MSAHNTKPSEKLNIKSQLKKAIDLNAFDNDDSIEIVIGEDEQVNQKSQAHPPATSSKKGVYDIMNQFKNKF